MAVSERESRRYVYDDLSTFPDDLLRREIIDGELIVNPAPAIRHQVASAAIHFHLLNYAKEHGGLALASPLDVVFAQDSVVEPDVLFVTAEHMSRIKKRLIDGPPDLVVEISSSSTRRLELVRKLELYERFGVPAYWYIDLDAERVELYSLKDGSYGMPALRYPDDSLECAALPGFLMPARDALALDAEFPD